MKTLLDKRHIAIFLGCIIAILVMQNQFQSPKNVKKIDDIRLNSVRFFDPNLFHSVVLKNESVQSSNAIPVRVAVIPHHLLASEMIANLFARLKIDQTNRIILLGPNHFEKGNGHFITSLNAWNTPFGILKVDPIFSTFSQNAKIAKNDEVLISDHALSAIMPFIKYYLPNAMVIPILISGHTSMSEIDYMSEGLQTIIDQKTVVIAVVDFSHNLSSEKAHKNDLQSLTYIKNYDFEKILTLNNDFLDSPASIVLLLKLALDLKASNMQVIANYNSGDITQNPYAPVTSYFEIVWR